ncbi:MAG TPA: serine/threonine-protein kinase [Pseudomonadales bacterium]
MAEDNDKTRIMPSTPGKDDATVLSATELDKLKTRAPAPSAGFATGDETVLSVTEMEQLKTRAPAAAQADDDATVALTGSQATVLAGGTEAVQQAISTGFSPRISVGSVIKDRFVLEKLLGRGGMGEVYLATDRRKLEAQDKNPYIAIKVLGENFKHHPQAFVALQREARKTQELAHPNIVTVYDFDRQGNTAYLTMEALRGKPMDEEIRSELRPVAEACQLIEQCAEGLAYAHKKGLVHSDLKPGNLFLTDDGNVKLLDFGIARAFHANKDFKQTPGNDDTVFDAGELGALTPAYATVEMIEGQTPHSADDVYAMGLIAYELLTGKHPFDKQMASKAEAQGLKPEPIKGLNKQQWRAIESALAFRRENRLQNAQAFLDAFTAKSKAPLYSAIALVITAFIALASLNLFVTPETGPAIPFAELPAATQQQITTLLDEARLVSSFQDYNSALLLLDQAFSLHPYNPDIMKQSDAVLEELLPLIRGSNTPAIEQVENLQKYDVLKDNKQLLAFKKSLQTQ